ncbi:MAG: hypothetical protein SGPRY_010212 [Prymnesium sp.]
MRVEAALSLCDTLPACRAITHEETKTTSGEVRCYFKNNAHINNAPGWSSWLKKAAEPPPVLNMSVGGTTNLRIALRAGSYTVAQLSRQNANWSFTRPLNDASSLPMCAHLGDVTLRLRPLGEEQYRTYSTIDLAAPARPLPVAKGGLVLAAQDITSPLASSSHHPLSLVAVRSYERSADGRALLLRLNLTAGNLPLELGAVGLALPESAAHPPATIESVVWADPHIGGEHGFVEFVRVVDDEATLLVTPEDRATTRLEGWRPMLEDLGHGDAYEWLVTSKAWSEEWARNTQWPFLNLSAALASEYPAFAISPQTPWPSSDGKQGMPRLAGATNPWNHPTSIVLRQGRTLSIALRLQLAAGGPRTRDETLRTMGSALLHGVPGYVIPTDLSSGRLLVKPPPAASTISLVAEHVDATANLSFSRLPSTPGGFDSFGLTASGRGRVRARLTFSDRTSATVHYMLLPPRGQQLRSLGAHLADVAWLPRDFPDPFGRSAAVMPWDRSICEGGKPCGHVLNDARAYDVGLSDDAGGGNPLCLASKVRAAPTQHEVSRLDDFIRWTLYGIKTDTAKPPYKSLQIREGEGGDENGIRMTMFYYAHDESNTSSGHFFWNYTEADKCHKPFGGPTWCMTENLANATYRGFNLPHHTAT